MRRRDALAALGALAALPACSTRPVKDMTLDEQLHAIANDPKAPLASLSTLSIRDGRIVHDGAYGQRNIALGWKVERDTLYRVASISKLVTTLGALKLVEAGKLDLDADASEYLGWRLRNPHFPDAKVTVRQMMAHTSSLVDDGGYYWDQSHKLADLLGRDGKHWSKRKPGSYFRYTNLTWGVIGTVMERITGERFDRYMQRAVLAPLGMSGGFNPADFDAAKLARVAVLYRKAKDDESTWYPDGPWMPQTDDYQAAPPPQPANDAYVPGTNGTLFGPQGRLRATAGDLGRVMLMLMNRGEHEGRAFLKPATIDLMLKQQWRYTGKDSGLRSEDTCDNKFYAWGLGNQQFLDISEGTGCGDRLVEGGGFKAYGHLGDAWGLLATFAFDPATKRGLIEICGGTSFDPRTTPGKYSSFRRYEERILTAMWMK